MYIQYLKESVFYGSLTVPYRCLTVHAWENETTMQYVEMSSLIGRETVWEAEEDWLYFGKQFGQYKK
jgi:hypothetical protein